MGKVNFATQEMNARMMQHSINVAVQSALVDAKVHVEFEGDMIFCYTEEKTVEAITNLIERYFNELTQEQL